MVLNEPMVFTGAGYFLGIHAPGKRWMKNFIPAIQNNALEISIDSSQYESSKSYGIRLRWKDSASQQNYYGVMASLEIISNQQLEPYPIIADWQEASPILNDSQFDGEFLTSPKGIFNLGVYRIPEESSIKSKIVYAYLFNTDIHYYQYHQALYRYDDTNPFAEPAPIYSNINGGLGVFAAYNWVRVITSIK